MKIIEVAAGIIKENGKIFVTERGYGKFKGFFEFPGGKLEANETPEQALKRELSEELAIEISVENFICTVHYDYPDFHLIMHCFYCKIQKGTITLLEHASARWLSLDESDTLPWLPADIFVLQKLKTEK